MEFIKSFVKSHCKRPQLGKVAPRGRGAGQEHAFTWGKTSTCSSLMERGMVFSTSLFSLLIRVGRQQESAPFLLWCSGF